LQTKQLIELSKIGTVEEFSGIQRHYFVDGALKQKIFGQRYQVHDGFHIESQTVECFDYESQGSDDHRGEPPVVCRSVLALHHQVLHRQG
jgi:hypothetical protein